MAVFEQLLLNGVALGCLYALIALGFALVFNTVHIFHLAHGAIYVWGGYILWQTVIGWGLPLPIGIIATLAFCALLGMGLEVGVYRPLRRRNAGHLIYLVASLGLVYALQNIAALIWGFYNLRCREGLKVGFPVGNIVVTDINIISIGAGVVTFVALHLFLQRTKTGTAIRAIANNPSMADTVGIDFNRTTLVTFAIGSAIAGVASIITALDIGMTPYLGFDMVILATIAVILGGVGSLPGAFLGGLFVGLMRCLIPLALGTVWTEFAVFAVMILVLIFRPRGFLGKKIWGAEV